MEICLTKPEENFFFSLVSYEFRIDAICLHLKEDPPVFSLVANVIKVLHFWCQYASNLFITIAKVLPPLLLDPSWGGGGP